jgi:hypothetical protein
MAKHHNTLRELFAVLGKDADWTDDVDRLTDHMFAVWFGREHGAAADKEQYDDGQLAAARPLLRHLGLNDRADPPSARYDEVVVMGAAGIGLYRRARLVVDTGVAARGITVLAGVRPHSGHPRDGDLNEWLANDGRYSPLGGWEPPPGVRHAADVLAGAAVDPLVAAQAVLRDETGMAELLIRKVWPGVVPTATVPVDGPDPVVNELGQRDWVLRTWAHDGPIPMVRLLNGAAAERHGPDGQPLPARPTSRSTVMEWVARVVPDPQVRRVLLVVNQPHLARVALSIMDLLEELGRGDVQLETAGCETLTDVSIHLLLGEIPARITLERRIGGSG